MKHDFQISQVVAPIGSPRDVKYVVIDTQPGAYSMYSLKDGCLVAIAPMLEIDKDYVAVGKYVSGVGEVEDDD